MSKTKTVQGVRVTAQTNGFRRAGRAWSTTPTDVPVSEFTEEQAKQLTEEPQLHLEPIDIEVPGDELDPEEQARADAAAQTKADAKAAFKAGATKKSTAK